MRKTDFENTNQFQTSGNLFTIGKFGMKGSRNELIRGIALFIFFVVQVPFQVLAQDVRSTNLTWSINQLTDLNAHVSKSYNCTFKSAGEQNIEWKQGDYVNVFTVTSVEGMWADITANGIVIFHVSLEAESGTIKFEKNSTGIFITINFDEQSAGKLNHKLSVSEVKLTN